MQIYTAESGADKVFHSQQLSVNRGLSQYKAEGTIQESFTCFKELENAIDITTLSKTNPVY